MEEITYSGIIERMKLAAKLKNDSAVARNLEVTPQALSNYKKRGRMPMNLVLKFSTIHKLSMDWLLTGEGKPYKEGHEGERPMFAMEEAKSFGKEELKQITAYAQLSPDELISVGKFLKVLRNNDEVIGASLVHNIDAILKATSQKH